MVHLMKGAFGRRMVDLMEQMLVLLMARLVVVMVPLFVVDQLVPQLMEPLLVRWLFLWLERMFYLVMADWMELHPHTNFLCRWFHRRNFR